MNSIDNSQAQTGATQQTITPQIALELLQKGNDRFLNNQRLKRDYSSQIKDTSGGQWPFACVLSCIDSRVPVEIVFDQAIGDVFSARVAGNFINPDILGSIEYACKVAGSKLVVIMGHTLCGAVKGACDEVKLGNITQMLDKISPAVKATRTSKGEDRSSKNHEFVNRVSAKNIELAIENLMSQSSVLKEMVELGEIEVVGAMYDVGTGKVSFDKPLA